MISYFRSILPSRLVLLVLLFLAIRVPLILLGQPATSQELISMLVGERLTNGFQMYAEVYDNTAPLAALFYWMIDIVTGRSVIAYRLVATMLLLLQAFFFNTTLNRHQVYAEKNYLPALIYLILGSITYEFDMLTPLLIGNTFIILSLPYIITISREGLDNSRLFVGGFMFGLAALSYLPLLLFLLAGTFAVIFFASNTFRSFLLMVCGFVFPYAMLMTYYLYAGSLDEFIVLHLLRSWLYQTTLLLSPADLVKVLALPALLWLLSVFSMMSLPQRLVFQVKFQQLMWVWMAVGLLVAFTQASVSAGAFVLILPAIAYFSEFFFTGGLKKWILNTVFFAVLAGVVILRYRDVSGINRFLQINDAKLLASANPVPAIRNTTVLVLGNDLSYYTNNKPATPYLNWQLAQRHFGNLNEYWALFEIQENFRKESPAYIVDKAGLMEELKYKLPTVFASYEETETAAVYKKRR
ncbi:hypothetical protein [Pontibacter sp. SGAir0037]|uniref:hypothetical protein n=1 Tax=Pontibacter sp. SGAir0037 TaxID=2571030 RepID=UPI0010CCB52C|nr:hypothetical protein [Pontibacter sp. SGAir0037]QCR23957.1 hypothetical protein C1N53_17435 [Pontibacter sp. SGAir0037]